MDFPKSVPSVGLVDGKFIDEDAVAGTPGSLIPSAWGNAVTLEMLKVIEDAGLVPDEDDNTQLSAAIQSMVTEGAVPFASKAEAEEGVVDNKAMSPLRVFQAIAKVVSQATETAFGWLKISTQALVNAGVNDATAVTPKKLAQASQLQVSTAFATGGTAAAQTLTPVPAISDYAPNQRFRVKFSQKSNGSGTINVSAKGAKDLKQYDSAGVKVPAVYAVDQLGDIEYDGTDFVLLDQLPIPGDLFNVPRVDVASAATVNLTTAAPSTRQVNITGSITIAGFTVAAGQLYFVRFDGAPQLTNSASLVTQSGGDIQTQAGDTCMLRATSANSVEVLCYTRSPKSGCTAWVSWNGTGTVAVRDSYNVSSITDNGVGDFTVNLATPMTNANYSFSYTVGGVGNVMNMASGGLVAPTVSALRVTSMSAPGTGAGANFSMTDFPINNVQIFGGK